MSIYGNNHSLTCPGPRLAEVVFTNYPILYFVQVHDLSEVVFTAIFGLEAALKLVGFGPGAYFGSITNGFDFSISVIR